jgi:uncharacterized repeat protein (TIGR02543 family)
MLTYNHSINTSDCHKFKIVLKNETNSTKFWFVWYKNSVKQQRRIKPGTGETEFHAYTIDLSAEPNWTGTINYFNIEVANSSALQNDVIIDTIQLLIIPDLDVTINSTGQGSVSPNGGTFVEGSNQTFTATADAGYEFTGWSGDITSTSNPLNITVDFDLALTASFASPPTIPSISTPSGFYCNFASASNVEGTVYNFWNVRQQIAYVKAKTTSKQVANCVRIVGGMSDPDPSHTKWDEKDNSFDPYKYNPSTGNCYYDWEPLIERVRLIVDTTAIFQFGVSFCSLKTK